jgi:hypothetical protein
VGWVEGLGCEGFRSMGSSRVRRLLSGLGCEWVTIQSVMGLGPQGPAALLSGLGR